MQIVYYKVRKNPSTIVYYKVEGTFTIITEVSGNNSKVRCFTDPQRRVQGLVEPLSAEEFNQQLDSIRFS